jgi:glycerol transport system ATP-binding protein
MTLKLEAVEKVAGIERHIYPLDLELETGSLTVLLGPIRAGKTSLMRLMAGLDRPSAGRILEDGRDVTGIDVRKRDVAMVYQQFINYPTFTVYENIASPMKVAGKLDRAARDAKVKAIAGKLGLTNLLGRLPAELSGGQQQRTALARALAKDAGLLLLDEPLVNLDYKLREELRAEMKALFRLGERTTVYATTEPLEALLLGGRTVVLEAGRLLQAGPALDVYRRPANLAAARIVSDPPMNILPGTVTPGGIGSRPMIHFDVGGSFSAPPDFAELSAGRYMFGLHAAHLSVTPFPGAAELPVILELAEINGSETLLHGRYSDLSLLLQMTGVHRVEFGAALMFYFEPARLYAFDGAGDLARAPSFTTTAPEEVGLGAH